MLIRVVGAAIVEAGSVLAAQRGPQMALPGCWEFPGGKVEPGESAPAALAREIAEELGCSISVGSKVATTSHEYEFGVVELTTFYATLNAGRPQASEHSELRWVPAADLPSLDWAPADLPAVALIAKHLGDPVQAPA